MPAKLPHGFVPPWMDMPTLCAHICATPNTVDSWVVKGKLPAPRKIEGKQMWEWEEVSDWIKNGGPSSESLAEKVRNGTRREKAERRAGH